MDIIKTIPEMISKNASERGNQTAFRHRKGGDWEDVSWKEVEGQVSSLGAGLIEIGLEPGDRVGILAENSVRWCFCYLAIISAGGVSIPIHVGLPNSQIIHIANLLGTKFLILSSYEQYKKIIPIKQYLPKLEKVIIIQETKIPGQEGLITYSDVLSIASSSYHKGEFNKRQAGITETTLADIGCTSGTQGQPKGVMLSHFNLMSNASSCCQALEITPPFTYLSLLPFSYIFERGVMLSALCGGSVIAFTESLETFERDIKEVKPDAIVLVPLVLEKIFNRVKVHTRDSSAVSRLIFETSFRIGKNCSRQKMETGNLSFTLSILNNLATWLSFKSIRDAFGGRCQFIICGGAELPVEIEEFFHAVGLKVLNGYGLTEASPVVTVNRPRDYKIGTVGKLLTNVQVKIKEDGEILFKGPNMTSGYYGNADATAAAIDREGWFHTGDIGSMDKDGFLKIIDRKDDIIILSSGDNIPPQKIESLLIADEFIDQALVIGDGKDFLAALIVPGFSNLRNWSDGEKIQAKDDLDLISNSKVIRFLGDRLKVINEELPYFEQIRKFALMSRDFRIELGEMTCTHKLRRKIINEKYGNLIKNIYQET